jgi:4-hydroxy-2-oxoglutarate aldolase
MTPAILAEHYREVADASPVPVVLYIVPSSCASVDVPEGLVAELSAHPNIVGLKDSRGDLAALGVIIERVPSNFRILIGNGAKLYAALEMGAAGGVLGVANLVPSEAAGIYESFVAGRLAEAGRLQELIAPLHREIVAPHGAAGVKTALDLLGFEGGPPRRPLRPLDAVAVAGIRSILSDAGLVAAPG